MNSLHPLGNLWHSLSHEIFSQYTMNNHLSTPFIERVRHLLDGIEPEPISESRLVPAGVMLLLFEKEKEYHILFQKRSQEVEHHKGEISFPGGVYDEGDMDLMATALRETWEEMGIKRDDVALLGQLSRLETTTNFRIVPFVGAFQHPYSYRINQSEVAQVLEVPIRHLQEPKTHWQEEHQWMGEASNRTLLPLPGPRYFWRYGPYPAPVSEHNRMNDAHAYR